LTALEWVRVGDVLQLERREVIIDVAADYEEIGVRSFGKGIFHKEPRDGASLGSKRVFRIEPGDLVISNVFAWEGAIAVASRAEQGKIGSHRFMTFIAKDGRIDTSWAAWYFLSEPGHELIRKASPGSAGRNKTLAVKRFEDLAIPLPPIKEQRRVVSVLEQATEASTHLRARITRAADLALAAQVSLASPPTANGSPTGWEQVPIGSVVAASDAQVTVEPPTDYRIAGTYSFGKGLIDRGRLSGAETSYKVLTRLDEGNIVVSKLNGWEGAVAVVGRAFHQTHVSSEYPTFVVDESRMLPGFFRGIARSPAFWRQLDQSVRGSMVRRRRLSASDFTRALVWLPPLEQQIRISRAIDDLDRAIERSTQSAARAASIVPAVLNREFGSLT
jgi:type I restriction enzyme S subunit